jgi:hypothetical protein
MRFRKLRIAWSLVWGLAAVLSLVLWVRSFWEVDMVCFPSPTHRMIILESNFGTLGASYQALITLGDADIPSTYWRRTTFHAAPDNRASGGLFAANSNYGSIYVRFPHWLAGFFSATLAAAPWIRWSNRFSLRTLLVATTVVVVVLGLIVWTAQPVPTTPTNLTMLIDQLPKSSGWHRR